MGSKEPMQRQHSKKNRQKKPYERSMEKKNKKGVSRPEDLENENKTIPKIPKHIPTNSPSDFGENSDSDDDNEAPESVNLSEAKENAVARIALQESAYLELFKKKKEMRREKQEKYKQQKLEKNLKEKETAEVEVDQAQVFLASKSNRKKSRASYSTHKKLINDYAIVEDKPVSFPRGQPIPNQCANFFKSRLFGPHIRRAPVRSVSNEFSSSGFCSEKHFFNSSHFLQKIVPN